MTYPDAPANPHRVLTSGANSIQIGGEHYKTMAIQPWDYIAVNNIGYFEGCVIEYVSRHQDKGGIEDLRKAMHCLEKLIEVKTREAKHG